MPSSKQDHAEQLDLFIALPSDIAARDGQDLMERPWFSLGKGKRLKPIHYETGDTWVRVTANPEHGIATIWDADILIWAVSQVVEARDKGLQPSRLLSVAPYELLKFMRREPGGRQYQALRDAMARLQSTTIETNIRQGKRRTHRQFSWINEWHLSEEDGRPVRLVFVIPDWLYEMALDPRSVLTLDRDYFTLSGGIDRWLWRLARKHVGSNQIKWECGFAKLHAKSGSTQQAKTFAHDLREAAKRNALPGYRMEVRSGAKGSEVMRFTPRRTAALPSPGA